MFSSNGRASHRLGIGRGTDATSNRAYSARAFWGGGSRRRRLFAALSLAAVLLAVAVAAQAVPTQANSGARPAPVTGVVAAPGDSPGEIVVTWDAHPDGPKDHRVAFKPVAGKFQPESDTAWNLFPLDNTVTLTGLAPGAEYRVLVRARFADGAISKWAKPVSGFAAAAETLPDESPSDDSPASNPAPSEISADKSISVPDDTEPGPGIDTRDHTTTSTTVGRSPDNPELLGTLAANHYSTGFDSLTSSNRKHYWSFTLTQDVKLQISVTQQEIPNAKLSLYVGEDEHRIVRHADGTGHTGLPGSQKYVDVISFVDLQPGDYGIRMEQTSSTYNYFTMTLQARPIRPQPDTSSNDGGVWTTGKPPHG